MFGMALLPFLDAERQVVGELLVEDRARLLGQARAAGGVGQHRVLDHPLMDGFHQRVVADGLHEDRAVVVARCRRDVDLQGQPPVFLQHAVVDVADAAEPGHALVVDVVRLVVEDGQFVDLADQFAEVGLAVRRLAAGPRAEGLQEVVAQVVVFQCRLAHLAEVDAVDVGEEQVAHVTDHTHVVLQVQRELEVVAPVAAGMAVVGQHRVLEEDAQAVEVGAQAVEHDDVGRDQQEVARELRAGFVAAVEEAPRDQQRQHLGLAGAGGHLHHIARPVLGKHAGRDGARGVEAQQIELVAGALHVVEPDHRLDRLALREVPAERLGAAIRGLHDVAGAEPPLQQRARGVRCAGIAAASPGAHLLADARHQWRQQALVGRCTQGFVGGEPAMRRVDLDVG